MIDGSYNATIHKNQLLVSSEPITISGTGGGSAPAAFQATPAAFQATPASTEAATPAPEGQAGRTQSVQSTKTLTVTYEPVAKPLSRIGERDDGFLNVDKILIAHPSDSRMEPWGPLNFTIATGKDSIVPVAMFRAVNGPTRTSS